MNAGQKREFAAVATDTVGGVRIVSERMTPSSTDSVKHTAATHQLLEWLREREANCLRIANAAGSVQDKSGWLEDAAYFNAAAKQVWESAEVLAALKDVLRIATAASIGVDGNKPRLERARFAIAKATGEQS